MALALLVMGALSHVALAVHNMTAALVALLAKEAKVAQAALRAVSSVSCVARKQTRRAPFARLITTQNRQDQTPSALFRLAELKKLVAT